MNRIIHGDALTELRKLESESVDCCITSPPYWALRDYKTKGQLGLESTFQEFVTKLVNIFDEVKRVLVKTGTCWVVIGDTYAGQGGTKTNPSQKISQAHKDHMQNGLKVKNSGAQQIQNKCLMMIPERFAISMVDHNWILRNKIIWYKPNGMPSSAKDRFTVDWEYVYFFTKSQKYFFETQYEPISQAFEERSKYMYGGNKKAIEIDARFKRDFKTPKIITPNPLGRIKRCVFKSDIPYMRLRKDLSEDQKKEVIGKLLERGLI